MREWASTMANAVQYGYPITDTCAADYRERAATSLRQATASAATDSDHNALALLTNEFQNVENWSNELVEAKRNMAAAKYTMSSDALRNEPLSQKIINCGHFLGAMLGSGDFKDDSSCH
jgi:phosphate-selective porin